MISTLKKLINDYENAPASGSNFIKQDIMREIELLFADRAGPLAPSSEDQIEMRMHQYNLIGIAGDNPELEARLIQFAEDCIRDARISHISSFLAGCVSESDTIAASNSALLALNPA